MTTEQIKARYVIGYRVTTKKNTRWWKKDWSGVVTEKVFEGYYADTYSVAIDGDEYAMSLEDFIVGEQVWSPFKTQFSDIIHRTLFLRELKKLNPKPNFYPQNPKI